MTYVANTEKPTERSRTFVVLRPKRRVVDWALHSGTIWVADFDYGDVVKLNFNGVAAVEGQLVPTIGPVLNADEWVYDHEEQKLYIKKSVIPDDELDWVVVFYEMRLSNDAGHWFQTPTDDSTREVYYDSVIIQSPTWRQEQSDVLFGFFPVTVSSLNLSNGRALFNRHVHDTSWHLGEIFIYHMLGDEDVANCKQIFRGYTRNVSWNNDSVQIAIESIFKVLEKTFSSAKTVTTLNFPTAEPDALREVWPIRVVFGRKDGFSPINLDYPVSPATHSTTNNRDWLVSQNQGNLAELTKNINPAGTNTSTQTTLTDVTGLMIEDEIYLSDCSVGVEITAIDTGTKIVTHSAAGARGVLTGATVFRSWVGYIYIWVTDGIRHRVPMQYWSTTLLADGCKGFTLVDNFEGGIAGFPSPFNPDNHTIYCRVYGEKANLTYSVGGGPVSTDSANGGNQNNIAATIYHMLRTIPGYDPEAIDEDSFADAVSGRDDSIGYSIPTEKTDQFPTYNEIILDLLRTGLMRLQINDFNGTAAIGISLIGPLATPQDKILDNTQFGRFRHELLYEDLFSQATVDYDIGDVSTNLFGRQRDPFSTVNPSSDMAVYLHEIENNFEMDAYLIKVKTTADPNGILPAVNYSQRVLSILSDRRGRVSLSGRNDLILAELGQTYRVDREQLPGYDFEEGTNQSRKYALVESEKGPSETSIVLEDQKGIEDNTSLW